LVLEVEAVVAATVKVASLLAVEAAALLVLAVEASFSKSTPVDVAEHVGCQVGDVVGKYFASEHV
jgi:hypothetical protein